MPAFVDSRRPLILRSVVVTVISSALLLGTSSGLPMVWDEGNAIFRATKIVKWWQKVVSGDLSPFNRAGIAEHWEYTTQIEGHPAFYGTVIACGMTVANSLLAPLDACRFGPIMLFGLAIGAMFYRLARQYDMTTACSAVVAVALLPRLFAHAHFASFDSPLVSCWILSWAAFAPARENWRLALLWGVTLGMTMSCKATGWVVPVPFVVWTIIYRDRGAARALTIAIPTAAFAFYLLNPPLWHDPINGLFTFLKLNSNREFNVPTQFLGHMYDLNHPLPWYNTLFWVAVTVPVGLLLLLVAGVVAVCRRWRDEPMGILLLGHWLVLLVVRALPFAPPHDAVRLFLPSFPFLAALVGIGAVHLISIAGQRRQLMVSGVLLLYLGSATSLIFYNPQWLSYYNLLIGGLPGAKAVGMEPTYYWDGLDRTVLNWLNENTDRNSKVVLAAYPQENLQLLKTWQLIEFNCLPSEGGTLKWYVVQLRPSKWQPTDRWLVENCESAYSKRIRDGGRGPWRLDVPLVSVYSYGQYQEAVAATSAQATAQAR